MDKLSLLKKDYRELYKLYDSSKDDLEKQLIKEVVDSKGLHEKDKDFQAYPDYHNKDFQKIIYGKKEFNVNQLFLDTAGIEDACNSEFSIKPHQNFLKNFMTKESPYKSLLIYHGVGVGKTCSALTVAENFRDPYARKEKRVLILSSKNIQLGWKKNIYDPEKGSNQCTGESFIHSGATTDRGINKLVKQYYELMAYQSFSNFVKRLVKNYVQRYPKVEREEKEIECIQQYFSNRYMIIDEVHNIRDEQGITMRDTVKTIEKVIKYSNNLRLVLLTATPMYNRSTEIIWILNMMLLNDNRPIINKKDVFDKEGELLESGKKILEDKCRGYISYLRGENPTTFPIRLYPRQLKDNHKKQLYPNYSNNKQISILYKTHVPSLNLVGGKILKKDKFKFLELYGSLLQGLQYKIYTRSIQNLIDANPNIDLDIRGELTPIQDNMMLTQINNMVYPSEKDNLMDPDIQINEYYGEGGINKCMNKTGYKYSYKKKILDTYGPIFDKGLLNNYSSKIKSILDLIEISDGIVFIYTAYIEGGIIPLQLALEQNGYKKHTGDSILKYPEWSPSSDKGKTKREPISFDGQRRSQVSESFQQGKYMVIDGSTPKKLLQQQLNIVNSKSNINGEKIKIILGTVVASEGLDFKRLRSVHIMDPWLHLNRIEQTVGRAIRFCSHSDLPNDEKNVLIYLHTTTLSTDNESIDTSIYRYAEKKSIQIGNVETILKQSAVDRFLYKDVNVIPKGSIQYVKMKPPIHTSHNIIIDPSDKPYSKVCSYNAVCDFNDFSLKENIYINEDTFIEHYSVNTIQNIKKKISLLYKDNYIYDIQSIVGLLNEYGYNVEYMIYSAIHEMVIHKYMIHDKHGNSGYLLHKHKYYIFQPYLLDDETIPLYYRMNLLSFPSKHILLPKLNEITDECSCSKQYSEDVIIDVYEKINNQSHHYNDDIINLIQHVYKDITENHIIIIGYLFDRLEFEDKCKLMYGYLRKIISREDEFTNNLHTLLSSFIIYKSVDNMYYFNNELTNRKDKIEYGFVLSYNHKPCFYEFYNDELKQCNQFQLNNLKTSLKRYKQTDHFKQFIKTKKQWGYTHMRMKAYTKECVLKFVQTNTGVKYPPGPGNVCIENNLFSKRETLLDAITINYSECKDIVDNPLLNNKKEVCFLLELILRYNTTNRFISFYPYDIIWLKYI